jgi:hypothetical protein
MKRYRLTKITVKTKEIISLRTDQTNGQSANVCPVCNTPLSPFLPATEDSPERMNIEQRTAARLSAGITEHQAEKPIRD